MHELAITKRITDMVLRECEQKKISPKKIEIELGKLTTYKMDSVAFYYDIIKKETELLKNTKLHIKEIDGKIICNVCKKESIVKDQAIILCPFCESFDITIEDGNDIVLKGIKK